MCENKEALVGFIYGELGPAEQHAFERHLSECAECRAEVVGLQATRGQLASWVPPDADLGFRIVRGPDKAARRRFMAGWAPAWGLAAAAVLVLAAAAALANIEVKYGADGVTVRTGWGRADAPLPAVTNAVAAPDGGAVVPRTEIVALQQRLKEIEDIVATRDAQPVAAAAPSRMSDAEILRAMREMIGEAQGRQQQQFAAWGAQLIKDFDRQRRVDLAAIEQGLGQFQAVTNAEIAQQRDMTNQLLHRVAAGREK